MIILVGYSIVVWKLKLVQIDLMCFVVFTTADFQSRADLVIFLISFWNIHGILVKFST